MFTTPEDCNLVSCDMFTNAPDARAQFADFDRLVAQELVDTYSWLELEGFYAEAAIGTLSQTEFEKLQARTTAEFEACVLAMLRKALRWQARKRESKRSIASTYWTVISDAISPPICTPRFSATVTTVHPKSKG
jgi:hypothetical protein